MSFEIPDTWTFKNNDVADSFEVHVREQLPWYEMITNAVAQIARHYIPEDGLVYDIGASTGNIARAIEDTLEKRKATLVAIEESLEMAKLYEGPGYLQVIRAQDFNFEDFDFATCFLVLMFMPPLQAVDLIDRLIARLNYGGAIVFVERTIPPDGYAGIVTSRMTLNAKREAGVTGEEIIAKELSLAGVQRPIDSEVFTSRGAVEFFRFGDFAGYLIEGKEELQWKVPSINKWLKQ